MWLLTSFLRERSRAFLPRGSQVPRPLRPTQEAGRAQGLTAGGLGIEDLIPSVPAPRSLSA